jgi:hypothetical protein
MSDVLGLVNARRQQLAAEQAKAWGGFVIDVTDGRISDPDSVLAALERLGKSAEELQAAVDRLRNRREWARQLVEREESEAEYVNLQQQLQTADRQLEKMIEEHHEKLAPSVQRMERCKAVIQSGADVRRSLLATVSAETRQAVFGEMDSELAALQEQQQQNTKAIQDCEHWLDTVRESGASAASHDQERIPLKRQQLQDLQKALRVCDVRLQALHDRRAAAELQLLKPDLF